MVGDALNKVGITLDDRPDLLIQDFKDVVGIEWVHGIIPKLSISKKLQKRGIFLHIR